jgi:hypothetical protein
MKALHQNKVMNKREYNGSPIASDRLYPWQYLDERFVCWLRCNSNFVETRNEETVYLVRKRSWLLV